MFHRWRSTVAFKRSIVKTCVHRPTSRGTASVQADCGDMSQPGEVSILHGWGKPALIQMPYKAGSGGNLTRICPNRCLEYYGDRKGESSRTWTPRAIISLCHCEDSLKCWLSSCTRGRAPVPPSAPWDAAFPSQHPHRTRHQFPHPCYSLDVETSLNSRSLLVASLETSSTSGSQTGVWPYNSTWGEASGAEKFTQVHFSASPCGCVNLHYSGEAGSLHRCQNTNHPFPAFTIARTWTHVSVLANGIWGSPWERGLLKRFYSFPVVCRVTAPHRCPHPNARNVWLCYLIGQKGPYRCQ